MTKSDIKKDLMNYVGGRPFISIRELAEARHIGRDSARALVKGLEYVQAGKRKDYLIEDVAARLAKTRRV